MKILNLVYPKWVFIIFERDGVPLAVRAGAPHSVVQKCMRVRSQEMVGFYATLSSKELSSAAKLAFESFYVFWCLLISCSLFTKRKVEKYQKYKPPLCTCTLPCTLYVLLCMACAFE